MPYKRTYRNKRRYNRRRYTKRKSTVKPMNVLYTKRTYDLGTFTADPAGVISNGLTFQLATAPNSAEFTSLFDQYKIRRVTVKFFPEAILGLGYYRLKTAVDKNDATAPTAPSIREDSTMRQHEVLNNRGYFQRTFSPSVLAEVYNSSISTGYATSRTSPWISTDYPNVPHFALKVYGDSFPSGVSAFKAEVTLHLAFKHVK